MTPSEFACGVAHVESLANNLELHRDFMGTLNEATRREFYSARHRERAEQARSLVEQLRAAPAWHLADASTRTLVLALAESATLSLAIAAA